MMVIILYKLLSYLPKRIEKLKMICNDVDTYSLYIFTWADKLMVTFLSETKYTFAYTGDYFHFKSFLTNHI